MDQGFSLVATLQTWIEVFMRHSMQDFILFAKDKELSMSQIGAMFRLHHQGGCGVSDLGEHLGVTSAAASQMLDRLVQQGLIERTEAPHDRRFKQLVLTDKGRKVLQDGIRARSSWLTELAQTLTPEQQEQVSAALSILIQKASELDQKQPLNVQPEAVP
jgi:DNA-binding MarR family transcriptional regulator